MHAQMRGRESTGLAQYYATLRAHVKLILLCMIVTFAAAVAYVKLAPKSYTATAQMVVQAMPPTDSALEAVPGLLHASGNPTTDVLTAASLAHTAQIAQATAIALHSRKTAAQILNSVSVVPTDQANILSVSTSSSDPRQAQRLVNAFANQVVAVRTAKLHTYIAREIPQLKAALQGSTAATAAATTTDLLGQLEVLQNGPDNTILVSAPATLPSAPTSPKTSLSLVAGLLIGLLIGVAAAFGIETLDPPVRREGELRERFGAAPVLAQVPQRTGAARVGPLMPMDLSAAALEQYRTVRTALRARPESTRGRAYLVSSATPGEGKSTSAITLAAMFAQSGADVILIDADLRRPAIGRALGGEAGYGTEDVLSGEIALSDALREVRLGPTRLRILPARGQSVEHANRLSPASAEELVAAAEQLADVVIIDSPPLTTVSDALPFAQAVDEVLLVVRVGQTKLSKLTEAWDRLGRQRTQPSGIILVGVREQSGSGYGYYLTAETASWQTEPSAVPAGARLSQPRRR